MITGGGSGQSAGFTISAPRQRRTPVVLRRRQGGFTIVETMIVLAVTGVMLLSVIGLVNGRQNKTEFQQAINAVVTQLQQTAREVGIGYYPGLTNCSTTSSGPTFNGSGGNQGANNGCVFLGKVVQFSPADVNNGNEEYGAYVLAGCQFAGCSTNASSPVSTSFADSKPTVATASTSWYTLGNGLSTVSMTYTCDKTQSPNCPATGSENQTRAVGFLQSFGNYGCDGGLCSGSQQADLYGVNITSVSGAPNSIKENGMVQALDAPAAQNLVPAQEVAICLVSGTTDQSGLITIGPATSSVSLKIFDGGSCGA